MIRIVSLMFRVLFGFLNCLVFGKIRIKFSEMVSGSNGIMLIKWL